MAIFDLTAASAIENAEHLKALGQTKVRLRSDEGFPYDRVERVEAGGSWRLNGPSSVNLIAEQDGLRLSLSVDFEPHEANGSGQSQFDRGRLRDLMLKLPEAARQSFADVLHDEVLPPLKQRTAEYRKALNLQADSEDCVLGLIEFARGRETA